MTDAAKYQLKMAQDIKASNAEVRTEAGIVVMRFPDGSILDFTIPEVKGEPPLGKLPTD